MTPVISCMLAVPDAPFFLAQPENNRWDSPTTIGTTTVRNHQMPCGTHRRGGFFDPFGHLWLVGDRSPLNRFPAP